MYKAKIDKWKLGKNVKTREMQHILRIKHEQHLENPEKRSDYFVRGHVVEERKIERFRRDNLRLSSIFPVSGTYSMDLTEVWFDQM